jgi:small-conductance mechanosensitive channel
VTKTGAKRPLFLPEQINTMEANKVYLKTQSEKIQSLIADDSKTAAMLEDLYQTVRQLRAKTAFRLALLNQLRETIEQKGENK